jgi:hypothetical protein
MKSNKTIIEWLKQFSPDSTITFRGGELVLTTPAGQIWVAGNKLLQ